MKLYFKQNSGGVNYVVTTLVVCYVCNLKFTCGLREKEKKYICGSWEQVGCNSAVTKFFSLQLQRPKVVSSAQLRLSFLLGQPKRSSRPHQLRDLHHPHWKPVKDEKSGIFV